MKLAFIFPGQGIQHIGMGQDFYNHSLLVKEMFDVASGALGVDISKIMFSDDERLHRTEFSQPCILLTSMAAFSLFMDAYASAKGEVASPVFALGHSLGELSALCAAGAIDLAHAIKLVHQRGILMQECCKGDAGMCVVLGLPDEVLEEFAASSGLWCANYNSDGQVVLAGKKSILESNLDALKALGAKRAFLLPISVASHCPMLSQMEDDFLALLKDSIKDKFSFKIISNVTTKPYESKQDALELLSKQLTNPVKYKQSIREFGGEVDSFIEFGSDVLRGLNKKIIATPTQSITNMQSLDAVLKALT